jgi:hypothetical protein
MGRRISLGTSFHIDVVLSCTALAEPLNSWRKDGDHFFVERSSDLSILSRRFLRRE